MPRRTKDIMFEESLFNNMQDYYNLRGRLIDLAIGRMKIKGLPKYMFKPFIYQKILEYSNLLFAYDDDLNRYFLYPYINGGGSLDEYNIPIVRQITLLNKGYTRNFTEENSVIFRTSESGTPLIPVIEEYARKLYIISRTIDINVNAQKTPVIVTCSPEQELTFKNLMKQYEGNVPFIFGNKEILNTDNVKVLNLNAPFVADKLQDLKNNVWNEFLTFLGISNVSFNKKERLISDEVTRGLGGVIVARNNFTSAMEDSIEEVNEKFGLHLEFSFGEDVDKDLNKEDASEEDVTINEERIENNV